MPATDQAHPHARPPSSHFSCAAQSCTTPRSSQQSNAWRGHLRQTHRNLSNTQAVDGLSTRGLCCSRQSVPRNSLEGGYMQLDFFAEAWVWGGSVTLDAALCTARGEHWLAGCCGAQGGQGVWLQLSMLSLLRQRRCGIRGNTGSMLDHALLGIVRHVILVLPSCCTVAAYPRHMPCVGAPCCSRERRVTTCCRRSRAPRCAPTLLVCRRCLQCNTCSAHACLQLPSAQHN